MSSNTPPPAATTSYDSSACTACCSTACCSACRGVSLYISTYIRRQQNVRNAPPCTYIDIDAGAILLYAAKRVAQRLPWSRGQKEPYSRYCCCCTILLRTTAVYSSTYCCTYHIIHRPRPTSIRGKSHAGQDLGERGIQHNLGLLV